MWSHNPITQKSQKSILIQSYLRAYGFIFESYFIPLCISFKFLCVFMNHSSILRFKMSFKYQLKEVGFLSLYFVTWCCHLISENAPSRIEVRYLDILANISFDINIITMEHHAVISPIWKSMFSNSALLYCTSKKKLKFNFLH